MNAIVSTIYPEIQAGFEFCVICVVNCWQQIIKKKIMWRWAVHGY